MIRTHRIVALVLLPIISQTFVVHNEKEEVPGHTIMHMPTTCKGTSLFVGVSADPQFSSGYHDDSDQSCDKDVHVSKAVEELDVLLANMKPKRIKSWSEAQRNCPGLTNNDAKLLFLQSEEFDVPRAAKKLADYWTKRVELFGDNAFLPMTLDGALRDDWDALKLGIWRLAGHDTSGRRIVFANPALHDTNVCSIAAVARANWYVIHAALEDEQTRRDGVVFVNYPARLQFSQLSPQLAKLSLGSEFLPVRIRGFHIVNPPKLFTKIVFPIIRAAAKLVSQQFHDMLAVHCGSDEEVIDQLKTVGIPRSALPTDMPGGTLNKTDHAAWLEERRAIGR